MTCNKKELYWDWIRSEAVLIESDGCSAVPDFYLDCCLQHDLSYYWAKNPTNAYRLYISGDLDYWKNADPIDKAGADAAFRKCIQAKSPWNGFSPMSWWRFLGLKLFGRKAWLKHAERRERREKEVLEMLERQELENAART